MSMDFEETDVDTTPSESPGEGRFNRGLRVVFILLILLSIVSGYATRPTIHAPMRRVLRDAQIVEVVRRSPSWERPYLEWAKRPLLVRHRNALVLDGGLISVESVFTAGGFYLGSRSMIEPSRHEARDVEQLERLLLQSHERYEPIQEIPRHFSLPGYWESIARETDLRWMTAFRAFPALLVKDTRFDEAPVPVMVLHLWCAPPTNRDNDVPEGEGCPQARRIVLELESGEIIRNDHLL